MSDIVDRLRALETCETELAHDGDCPPEATANWKYAETCRIAADRIEQLEAELTIQYQDGHHDGYEKGCTISKEASERYDRIDARIERLGAALREIAYFEISSSVGDIYGDTQKEWLEAFDRAQSVARAALGEEHT